MFRRRADTPKKYEHIDFTPPEGAANAAAKGLEYREKASPSNKGGLTPAEASKEGIGSGVQRAVNLKNRDTLSPDTIKQMHGFFSRHEKNKGIAPEHKGKPWNDKGYVSWLLWGGDPGKAWVDKVLGQMEKADEKAESKKAGLYKGAGSEHAKSLALAKFLGRVAQRARVAQHVYIVGGAVRNYLLNQPIKDIDVVVDSVALRGYDSERFAKDVARAIPVATNLTTNQYGVAILTVKGPWLLDNEDMEGEVIEIANARGESYGGSVGKSYKPSEVVPATIEEDVYRREFTFNTLLWRLMDVVHGPERAEVIDLTGCGRSDLEKKVMRCPRDPDVVFSDDPTRMLRALKFAIRYGFDVPPDLQASIKRNASKLASVPYEAVGIILVRDIFGTPRAREMLRFMDKLGLLEVIRDMLAANKSFAAYLTRQLTEREAAFLLDMDDYNMGLRLPLSFLSPAQRTRVREVLDGLTATEQKEYVAALTLPPVDNRWLIQQFSLKPQDRGRIQPLAREALLNDPSLADNSGALTQAVAQRLAGGRTASTARVASTTGDGTSVGFFIPLSADLASQYEVMAEDPSPPHVTFLYVGKVAPSQVPTLLRVAREVLRDTPPVFGVLNGVDSFVQEDKNQRVLYSRVVFSHDLKPLRDRLWAALTEAGFKVEQAFPTFTPHVTIEYRDGVNDAVLYTEPPSGAWDCTTIEVWGLPKKYSLPIGPNTAMRVAARYKEKKQVPKADGSGKTTVYVYSERQVANRHREKAERLEDFKPALTELRAQVKKDLDANDPKKNLVALAVGLIDATYERVGNEDSADKGHYGVTGWLRKHVTFKGKRAVIRYVGKSGVKHEKSVDDETLVGALKKCCGDKDGEEAVLSLGKYAVTSDDVNKYLKPYGITAKDLRGLHANREMQERLRAIRSKGPKLPRLRKERDPILKEEFKKALEGAAEAVGHEPATLRKQYLVPGIEEAYMKDGTVPRDFTASARVAARYLNATKSDAEREDEEAERLLKPEPKYKPPRKDLRRRRVETEGADDPDKKQDDKDRSQNYKDAAHRALVQRVAARFLFAESGPGGGEPSDLQERAQKEFDAYAEEHPETELTAADFAERIKKQRGSSAPDEEAQAAQRKAELKGLEAKRKAEGVQKAVDKISEMWEDMPNIPGMSEQNRKRIKEAVSSFGPKKREEFLAAFQSEKDALVDKYAGSESDYDPAFVEEALQSMENTPKGKDPKAVGKKAMQAIFTDRVLLNPLMLTPSDPLSDNPDKGDEPHSPAKAAKRVGQAVKRFSRASKAEVNAMSGRLKAALKACEPGSPQHEELLAMQYGMAVAAAMPKAKPKGRHGDDSEGEDGGKPEKAAKPPEGMSGVEFGLLQHLHKKGSDISDLVGLSFRNSRNDKSAVADTKKFVRKQAEGMTMNELNAVLPPSMKSLSAAFVGLKKSLPFVSEGFLSGFSEKKRDKQRQERGDNLSEDEAKVAAELRTTLVDCVSETVGQDEEAVANASAAAKGYARSNPPPKGGTGNSSGSWGDWLKRLREKFMKALKPSKAASRRDWSPTVPGYSFDPPLSSVAGLYTA